MAPYVKIAIVNPLLKIDKPINFKISDTAAEEVSITIHEFRKPAFEIFPTLLANNHKISAPITDTIKNKIIPKNPKPTNNSCI